MNPLAKLSQATTALAEARTLEEIKAIRDMAEQARLYAQANKLGLDAINAGTEIRLRADRKMGEVLILAKETGEIKHGGDRKSSSNHTSLILRNVGLSYDQSSTAQQLAKLSEQVFEARIEEAKAAQERLTTSKIVSPHVANNSGNNEWYTPKEYIAAARLVMGGIDVDPASSAKANEVVQATCYHSVGDSGLSHDWRGRVWLNPPYAAGLIQKFVSHLRAQRDKGNTKAAIVLVNNATETQWFAELVCGASAVVFPTSRVRFWGPDGEKGAPLQGQALVYIGDDADCFLTHYRGFGWGARL